MSEYAISEYYHVDFDLQKFSRCVFREFYIYENGNGNKFYEYHWYKFPHDEFYRLKDLLKIKTIDDFS